MALRKANSFKPWPRRIALSVLSGILSGAAAAVFLILLEFATQTRNAHPSLIWCLPLAGFGIGWVYYQFGKTFSTGNNLILEEIHNPKNTLPLRMAPFVLIGTVLTHLFGGSAGREGTAVQMGASLSDQLSRFFKVSAEERRTLLVTGTGAGFGAAIGAPWAGMLFGMEVIQIGKLRFFALAECFIASFVAYGTALILRAPHSVYPQPFYPSFEFKIVGSIIIAGIIFGLTARFFSTGVHWIEKCHRKFFPYPPLKPLVGGLLLVLFYYWEGSYRYVGLGIPVIQKAIVEMAPFKDPFHKMFYTALTVGSGFKGGEFIPLVFMGTTLGSALAHWLPVGFPLLAAVGFAAVFAAASNTPLACTVMAMEIFGYQIGIYALLGCYFAYLVSGHHGIYSAQKTKVDKHHRFKKGIAWLGEFPKRFF